MTSVPGDSVARGASQTALRVATTPLALAAVAAWLAITWLTGLRQGFLFLIGIAYGAALAGASFGFTTGWRVWMRQRDPTGFLAQLLAIGLAMLLSIPLIATHAELSGAFAPIAWCLPIGAFVFGAAMQVADGCGSGTLYKAGLGNAFSLAVLPGFIAGSFVGAAHLDRWLALGSLEPVSLPATLGAAPALLVQLAALGAIAWWLWAKRGPSLTTRWSGRAIYSAAIVLALAAVLNLVVAGQPWGIVYGLGLWGAKVVTWLGADLASNAYWGRAAQQAQIHSSLLTDVTSVTNLGLLAGALIAANARGTARPAMHAPRQRWIVAVVAGVVLGYSSRLAFGCNVGAYFAGISTGSLHGWIWLAAAFAGSLLGVRVRERLGLRA